MRWDDLKRRYVGKIDEMTALSPYDLLGVATTSSDEDIKAAYLRLVKVYHPDRSDKFMARHCDEMMKLINAAYDQLRRSRS